MENNNPMIEVLNTRFNQAEWLAILNKEPKRFNETLDIALSDNKPQAWRATWLLRKAKFPNDPRVAQKIDGIIDILPHREEGHQRELLKLIEGAALTDEQEGKLFDVCLSIWEAIGKQGSVRITALETLLHVATKYPELKVELKHLTDSIYLEGLTPGIKRSFEKRVAKYL